MTRNVPSWQNLAKNLDLAQDYFPNKILRHILRVKMFAKKSSNIFR